MSRYNHHFQNHFSSCPLLAKAHDPYRNRDVELRMLPGEFDVVGVTDGTDAWVAPVAGDPFRVGVARLIDDVRHGRKPMPHKPRRTIVTDEPAHKPRTRITVTGRIIDEDAEKQRLLDTALEQQRTITRRRIHVSA